jgi:hypothetical protein
MKPLSWLARGGWALLALPLSLPSRANAQECAALPDFPTAAINTTQDRDQMMCQLGRVFPTLPVRQGTAWPWNDPTAPTNAWPTNLANPEGNWTDAQRHTVVRTRWGNWHTYDGDPMFNPDPGVHFPNIPSDKNGGAMSGYGDYGPYSNPRYTDIDLLAMKSGAPVLSREDWWTQRRPEIFNLVQQQLYGTPLDPSIPVAWVVTPGATGTQTGSDGQPYAYREKTIVGTVDTSSYPELRNTPVVRAVCRYPAEAGRRVPVVITYGEGVARFQYTAPYGIGTCSYTPGQVQPDSGGANLSSYVIGLVNKGHWRKPSDPGSLVAWGWGVSRLIDALQSDPDFDGDKVAVEGHSRFGKSTLVAAAYDTRIAVAWPSDAGAMGTAMARRTYGESLDFVVSATNEYHWMAGNAMNYAGAISPDALFPRRVEYLDVDAHSTTSLIAPRAIFVTNGTDTPPGLGDAWADPRGCWLSGHLASPVWEHLGWKGQVIPEGTVFTGPGGAIPPGCTQCQPAAEALGGTPPFDVAFIEGTVGWRRQKEGHTAVPNWPSFMLFASRYLNDARPAVASGQSFVLGAGHANVVGTVQAADADGDRLEQWQIKGGSGAYKFAIDSATGLVTIADASALDFAPGTTYDLTVMVGDGKLPSHDATVTITVPQKVNVCHKNGKTLSISSVDVPDHVAHGDAVGTCE